MPDTIVRVNLTDNSDQFYLSGMGTVTALNTIDPYNWIINKTGTIVQDPTFTSSIETIVEDETWRVYPNPSLDEVTISWTDGEYTLRIMDSRGQTIQTIEQPSSSPFIINGLKSGMYIVEIISSKGERKQRRILSL
jgi:hypothetical protein